MAILMAILGVLLPIIAQVLKEILSAPDTQEVAKADPDLRNRLLERIRSSGL